LPLPIGIQLGGERHSEGKVSFPKWPRLRPRPLNLEMSSVRHPIFRAFILLSTCKAKLAIQRSAQVNRVLFSKRTASPRASAKPDTESDGWVSVECCDLFYTQKKVDMPFNFF